MAQDPGDGTSSLRARVQALIDGCLGAEREQSIRIDAVRPEHRASAINLVHYVWLRGRDIRELQGDLADLGLSSLGRLESRVMPTLQALAGALDRMSGTDGSAAMGHDEMSLGPALLERNARDLLGPQPPDRVSRIMVTFPSEAATDAELVREMVDAGMDIARINCAHDDPEAWAAMIEHLKQATPEGAERRRIAMDLAGPKIRTGPVQPGPRVIRVRPRRDSSGLVEEAAVVELAHDIESEATRHWARLPVESEEWLRSVRVGKWIRFIDARGSKRRLLVTRVQASPLKVITELEQTAYFADGTLLRGQKGSVRVGGLPAQENHHLVNSGEQIWITRDPTPHAPVLGGPHRISCTEQRIFDDIRAGHRIFFDDGKIGGTVVETREDRIEVDVTSAGVTGVKLREAKGINLPDTHLDIPALTDEDMAALPFVVEHADIVNYSFVRTPTDVAELFQEVLALGRDDLDVVLKVETVESFENLPQILLEAMRWKDVGVMIARGDLAVEAGFERLAEVQEEILWLCEAPHVPVVWATQVLETLTKSGRPSRAEVTDAAMSERAECVMLNKGPYIVDAILFLHDVLERMQEHVSKKRTLLRQLHSWDLRHGRGA